MPRLLEELINQQSPSAAFEPVSKVLEQILTRTTFGLLCENQAHGNS